MQSNTPFYMNLGGHLQVSFVVCSLCNSPGTQGDGSAVSFKPFERCGMAIRLSCKFAAGLIRHFSNDPIAYFARFHSSDA